MCLAIPGKIVEIENTTTPRMGLVAFGGVRKRVCLEWIADPKIGDYVLVHVGFAISKMNEEEAVASLDLFEQFGSGIEDVIPDRKQR